MKRKTYADGVKAAWDCFNKHGIGVLPDTKPGETMFVTISHGKTVGDLSHAITFTRPVENGILSWLPDAAWQALRDGKVESD